jgi:capsular exopolysaccharide synthesis family protein
MPHPWTFPPLRGFFRSSASENPNSTQPLATLSPLESSDPQQPEQPAPDVQWTHPLSDQSATSSAPPSLLTEAYRTLRTALLLSQAERAPKVLLFTSATHAEGKTVTVLNTARVFADVQAKVLVIDADLRRPSCSRILLPNGGTGLTELLTGQEELIATIKFTSVPSLFFLSSGVIPPNPVELVGSKKMQETLTTLREHFDYILIDAPPLLPVSDALLLSGMVDGVVFVADSQRTPRTAVREACARLAYAHAKVLGVVLNRVLPRPGHYQYAYEDAPNPHHRFTRRLHTLGRWGMGNKAQDVNTPIDIRTNPPRAPRL